MAAAIDALRAAHGGIGHNQGPSLLDAASLGEIAALGDVARGAVEESPPNRDKAGNAQERLATIGWKFAAVLGTAAVSSTVSHEYDPMLSLSVRLFHALWAVVLEISSWLYG